MRIVILGGAGMIGREIAADLAADRAVSEIVIADRDPQGARRVAQRLRRPGVRAARVDVADRPASVELLRGAGAVINAVQYDLNLDVMEACLEAKTDYIDLGGLFHTTRRQLELDDRFRAAGRLAILGLGSCPGVANLQARALAGRFETLASLRIYNGATVDAGDSIAWGYSIHTILDEMSSPAMVFRDGRFVEAPALSGAEIYRFQPPIGATMVHLSLHSEVATLPLSYADKGLRECSFKISRFGYSETAFERLRAVVDLGLAGRQPVRVGENEIVPRDLLIELLGRMPRPRPAAGAGFKEIVTEARGTREGKPAMAVARTTAGRHGARGISGGTLLVAAPPAIIARELARGAITARGVLPPEQVVDPDLLFRELEARGATTVLQDLPVQQRR